MVMDSQVGGSGQRGSLFHKYADEVTSAVTLRMDSRCTLLHEALGSGTFTCARHMHSLPGNTRHSTCTLPTGSVLSSQEAGTHSPGCGAGRASSGRACCRPGASWSRLRPGRPRSSAAAAPAPPAAGMESTRSRRCRAGSAAPADLPGLASWYAPARSSLKGQRSRAEASSAVVLLAERWCEHPLQPFALDRPRFIF